MNVEDFKAVLVNRKGELSARLRGIESELSVPHPDDDDRATAREDTEVLESLGEQGLVELRSIDQALHRIDHGNYGICVGCGDPVSHERLHAIPHTALCSGCATRRGGDGGR